MLMKESAIRRVVRNCLIESITYKEKPYSRSLKLKGYNVESGVRLLKILGDKGKGGGLFHIDKPFLPSDSTSFKLLNKEQFLEDKDYYKINYEFGFINSEERFLMALEDNRIVQGPLTQVDVDEISGEQEEIKEWKEDYFLNFINNWKLFKKNYPNASLIWELLDPAGTTGYAGLAEYLEVYNKKSKTYFYDDFLLFLYILGASPVGLVAGTFGGRLLVQSGNFMKKASEGARLASSGGLKAAVKGIAIGIFKASDKFADLLGSAPKIQKFIVEASSSVGLRVADDIALKIGQRMMSFANMIDSSPARVFFKLFLPIFSNAGSDMQRNIIETLTSIDSTSELLRTIEGLVRGDKNIKDIFNAMEDVYDQSYELFSQVDTEFAGTSNK